MVKSYVGPSVKLIRHVPKPWKSACLFKYHKTEAFLNFPLGSKATKQLKSIDTIIEKLLFNFFWCTRFDTLEQKKTISALNKNYVFSVRIESRGGK